MSNADIAEALRGFIRERFGVPEDDESFTDDVDLFNYGYVDSFGGLELGAFVEQRFGVPLTSDDWATFRLNTIRDLAEFVSRSKVRQV